MDFIVVVAIVLAFKVAVLVRALYGQRIKYKEEVRKAVCDTHALYHFSHQDHDDAVRAIILITKVIEGAFHDVKIADPAKKAAHEYNAKRARLLHGGSVSDWHSLHQDWLTMLMRFGTMAEFLIDPNSHIESLNGRLKQVKDDWASFTEDVGCNESGVQEEFASAQSAIDEFSQAIDESFPVAEMRNAERELEFATTYAAAITEKTQDTLIVRQDAEAQYSTVVKLMSDISKHVRNGGDPLLADGFDRQCMTHLSTYDSALKELKKLGPMDPSSLLLARAMKESVTKIHRLCKRLHADGGQQSSD